MAKRPSSSAARLPSGDPVLAANLKAARKRAGLTLEKLAGRCAVTKGLLSQVEKAQTMPSVPVLKKLGEVLECGVDMLLDGNHVHGVAHQRALPGMSVDERVAALPEALREFVMLSLARAERAKELVPSQFLTPPTSDNWPQFVAYLESISPIETKMPK